MTRINKKIKSFSIIIAFSLCCIVILSNSLSAYKANMPPNYFNFNSDSYQYFTYEDMTDFLFTLQSQHPTLLSMQSLGKSYENRDIWLVNLSNQNTQLQQKPAILLLGAHHGNEKPSFEILLFFIYYMLENYEAKQKNFFIDELISSEQIKQVLNSTIFYIIPMVNPDGVEANTRKNCEPNYGPFGLQKTITSYGVNLNRNYKDNWFLYFLRPLRYHFFLSTIDSSFNYKGPYPFSSNETRSIKEFVETKNISISLSYHTYSEIILYPWMHTSLSTPHEKLFRSIGENMSLINNYRLITKKNHIIPRFAGTLGTSENWLYRTQGILSFTMELCREYAPTNGSIIKEACLSHSAVHLYLSERVQTIQQEKTEWAKLEENVCIV